MAWKLEMRSERHGQRLLPSLIRWQKRSNRAKARALMMREYWQYQAAEDAELLELVYADLDYSEDAYYDPAFSDWEEKQAEMAHDRYDYPDGDWDEDYGIDPFTDPHECRCPYCRPDLYADAKQYGPVTFYPLKVQPKREGSDYRNDDYYNGWI